MLKNNTCGWLLLDKPEDITSACALNKIKRFVLPSKIGHAGTLDPFASGLLMVAIGSATKLISYAMNSEKCYRFTVKWGVSTDTLDCQGAIVKRSNTKVEISAIMNFIKLNRGFISQTPPRYSAVNIRGKKAYELARSGVEFEISPKNVEIKELKLIDHNDERSSFILRCSKGFYVRSLVRDMAAYLGVCAHTEKLRRVQIGKFDIKNAITLDYLVKLLHNAVDDNPLESFILPLHSVLDDILVHYASVEDCKKLAVGRVLPCDLYGLDSGYEVAVFDETSMQMLGICIVGQGCLKPKKILNKNV